MRPVKLDTVFAIRGKHAIAAYCVACRRHAWVDLARVAETCGSTLPLARLKQRLTCERCGRRGAEMRLVYQPADAPGGYPCAISLRATSLTAPSEH